MENKSTEVKILEAAFRVVDRYTISGTRMHLIAEEAKMVQSNLHYYFKTKQDLMLALLKFVQKNFSLEREEILSRSPKNLEGQIQGFFQQKKEIILHNPAYDRVQYDFWNQGQIESQVNEGFFESYNIWRTHIFEVLKMYSPDVEEERLWMAACIMVSMMMGASLQYLNSDKAFELDAYFNGCTEMVISYLEEK